MPTDLPAISQPFTATGDAEPPVPGDTYVQSFARGLGVIRSFSADAPKQTITQVSAATGLTRAGARRVLLTLQSLGYADSDGKLFWLLPRILDLGFSYLSSQPLWHLSEPLVEAMVERLKESSSIAVLDGPDVVYMLRVPTRKVMRVTLGVGSRLPAIYTSLGRVMLADLPEDALADLLRRHPPQALTERSLTDPAAIVAAVHTARRQGWAMIDRELEEGLVSVAAPITDRAGRTVAALNVGAPYTPHSMERLREQVLPELLDTARDISALLQRT